MSKITYFEFVETETYAKAARGIIDDAQQRLIEETILRNPLSGDVIPGAGVRKIRVAFSGRGKSGGARVIYFAMLGKGKIYLLNVYVKNRKENVTEAERKELAARRRIIKGE